MLYTRPEEAPLRTREELARRCELLQKELDRLFLPWTEDGDRIGLHDFLWRTKLGGGKTRCQVDGIHEDYLDVCDDGTDETESRHFGDNFFYTREAKLDEDQAEPTEGE